MKIRNGFVSNSSTSSFLLAIPNDMDECDHCGFGTKMFFSVLIDTLNAYRSKTKYSLQSSYEDYLNKIQTDLKEIREDIKESERQYQKMKSMIDTGEIKTSLIKVSKFYDTIRILQNSDLRSLKQMMECVRTINIKDELKSFKNKIDNLKHSKKELEENLSMVKSLKNIKEIIEINMDCSWRSDVENRIALLAEKGIVKVLKEDMT
jgi:predicted RNase H-like nuclease (RuvC/YqgF family)